MALKARRAQSKRKGKTGELELVQVLKSHGYEKAYRGQQYQGGTDSPDVVVPELPGFHFECKRTEAFQLYPALAQAIRDGAGQLPIVAHRRNGQDWVAVLKLSDLLDLLTVYGENNDASPV